MMVFTMMNTTALRCQKDYLFPIGEIKGHNDKPFVRIDFHIDLHGFKVIQYCSKNEDTRNSRCAGGNVQKWCGYGILLLIKRIYVSPHRTIVYMERISTTCHRENEMLYI